jgi:hypothetical protein
MEFRFKSVRIYMRAISATSHAFWSTTKELQTVKLAAER